MTESQKVKGESLAQDWFLRKNSRRMTVCLAAKEPRIRCHLTCSVRLIKGQTNRSEVPRLSWAGGHAR